VRRWSQTVTPPSAPQEEYRRVKNHPSRPICESDNDSPATAELQFEMYNVAFALFFAEDIDDENL
jgi:hypothetical protein